MKGLLKDKALKYRKLVGSVLSPDDAYRLASQLSTLELRFQRQCENAMELAQFLEGEINKGIVSKVRYPGLSTTRHIRNVQGLSATRAMEP
jgi:cystathionine beta-lyase/cystathionine gamma-synthase